MLAFDWASRLIHCPQLVAPPLLLNRFRFVLGSGAGEGRGSEPDAAKQIGRVFFDLHTSVDEMESVESLAAVFCLDKLASWTWIRLEKTL